MSTENPSQFNSNAQPSKWPIDNSSDLVFSVQARRVLMQFQSLKGQDADGVFSQSTQEALFETLRASGVTTDKKLTAYDSVAYTALQEHLEQRTALLRDEHNAKITAPFDSLKQQKLTAHNLSDNEEGLILDSLSNASNLNDFKARVTPLAKKNSEFDNDKTLATFLNDLWILEADQRHALDAWDGDISLALSDADTLAFSTLDVLNIIQTGIASNSLDRIAGPQKTQSLSDDRFFSPEVYTALKNGRSVDGVFLDQKAGVLLSQQDVAQIAYNTLLNQLEEKGIKPDEMTQAIFTGKFNPNFDDLQLIQLAAGRPSFDEILDNPDWKNSLARSITSGLIDVPGFDHWKNNDLEDGLNIINAAQNGDSDLKNALEKAIQTAPAAAFGRLIHEHQADFMNNNFGSLHDIQGTTIRQRYAPDGKVIAAEEDLSGERIALDLINRFDNAQFENHYNISIDEARQRQIDGIGLPVPLQEKINATLDNNSLMDYFSVGEHDRINSDLNFQANYQLLRDRYVSNDLVKTEQDNLADNNPTRPDMLQP